MAPIENAPLPQLPAIPKLHMKCLGLSERGSQLFFSHTSSPHDVLEASVTRVLKCLYPPTFLSTLSSSVQPSPTIRSITLHLRDLEGVAYTCGSNLDEQHKEIHLSTSYLSTVYSNSNESSKRLKGEIEGVLTHELVHVFQWNGRGTTPGGVIEGIADWVRNECGLGPPHWREGPSESDSWDAGYQTTGFFLKWISHHISDPLFVPKLNFALQNSEWNDGETLKRILGGRDVEHLWKVYKKSFEGKGDDDGDAPKPVPTHRPGYQAAYR